jgi:hypothetical protein
MGEATQHILMSNISKEAVTPCTWHLQGLAFSFLPSLALSTSDLWRTDKPSEIRSDHHSVQKGVRI